MIVRALLAIGSVPLRRRIERLLRPHGVVVTTTSGSLGLRDRLRREDVDLVVATRAELPENLADFVQDLRALPEQPEVVVVEEKLDSAGQASALAAGCL